MVRAISGYEVEPLRPDECPEDAALLRTLARAAEAAKNEGYAAGIQAPRVNEAGSRIEELLRRAILAEGLPAVVPSTQAGKKQTRGYPDIELTDQAGRRAYLEVKTFSAAAVNQTQRSFYLSVPADQSTCKITADARHLLVSFRVQPSPRSGQPSYDPVAWGIRDAADLRLRLKHEFNASNREIYDEEQILAKEGILWGEPRQLPLDEVE